MFNLLALTSEEELDWFNKGITYPEVEEEAM